MTTSRPLLAEIAFFVFLPVPVAAVLVVAMQAPFPSSFNQTRAFTCLGL